MNKGFITMFNHSEYNKLSDGLKSPPFIPQIISTNSTQFNTLGNNIRQNYQELSRAIADNEFEVYYQPQVCSKRQKVTGVEALIRWNHPEKGLISPLEFIPLAEDLGLISTIDELVFRTACRYIKSLQKEGIYLSVAINLSSLTFEGIKVIELVKSVLNEYQLEAKYLEIELTETIVVKYFDQTLKTMNELREMGVKLSLDDFGTGYSGLLYLQKFPWNVIKIDRSFLHNLVNLSKNNIILQSIINLAHKLDLEVIAEGIESEYQLNFLLHNYCYRTQGYLFSPPVQAKQLKSTIQKINKQLNLFFCNQVAA